MRSLIIAVSAAGISASAATYNGDLFLGFTTQSGKDLIYDIGPASSLFPGKSWNLGSSLLGAGISSVDNVKWGVIGDKNLGGQRYTWSTVASGEPPTLPSAAAWGSVDTPLRSMASQFGTLSIDQSVTPDASFDNSWNQQTIVGTLTTQFHNTYVNPNAVGATSARLFRVLADGSKPELVGAFNLIGNGTAVFVAPEPGTYALLAMGLVAFALSRRFIRNA